MAAKKPNYISNQQDNDGSPPHLREEASVKMLTRAQKKNGPPENDPDAMKKWKKKVIDRFRDTGHTKEADYLENNWGDDNNVSDDDAFSKVWGEKAGLRSGAYSSSYLWDSKGSAGTSNSLGGALQGNDEHGKKVKDREALMSDPTYQEITSVSRVRPDGTTGGPGPGDNYAVWPKSGRLIKVQFSDGSTHFMPSDDTNPLGKTSGELSYHAATSYGSSNAKTDMGALGSNPGYLSNDQWDFIGQNNLKTPDGKFPNNQKDFDDAVKDRDLTYPPPKKESSAGGGPKLTVGYATVMHGADERTIGYADCASVHEAGGHMIEGSKTVFVGCELHPVSRVGDATSDGLFAQTGATDFLVG